MASRKLFHLWRLPARPKGMSTEAETALGELKALAREEFGDRAAKLEQILDRAEPSAQGLEQAVAEIAVTPLLFVSPVPTSAETAAGLLANAFFLVIGFYFGRTNHARLGDQTP